MLRDCGDSLELRSQDPLPVLQVLYCGDPVFRGGSLELWSQEPPPVRHAPWRHGAVGPLVSSSGTTGTDRTAGTG